MLIIPLLQSWIFVELLVFFLLLVQRKQGQLVSLVLVEQPQEQRLG
jgi:hypothetical protein